jgi:hypothetical protein
MKKAVNAGVHASIGLEFQKHCALSLLFEKYQDMKHKKYFICLEHHDDFLFCYQTNDDSISSIDAYQAKKSSVPWTMNAEIFELIKKMTDVGLNLNADNMPKTNNYTHNLEFITNNSITLNNGKRKKGEAKSITINESNCKIKFVELDEGIKKKIEAEIRKTINDSSEGLKELNNISIAYIDFPKTNEQ